MDNSKVKEWIDEAYVKTAERIQIISGTSYKRVFRTTPMYRKDTTSHLASYVCYFYGYFESMIVAKFLDAYDRMPTESENMKIIDLISGKWEDLLDQITEAAIKNHDIDMKDASMNVGRGR